jgi:hypothetical protein
MLGKILDWSEVWALFLPLHFINKVSSKTSYLYPVRMYIWIALLLNLCIDTIMEFKIVLNLPSWLRSNNFLYNLHSVVRLLLFSWFFIRLHQRQLVLLKKIIPVIFLTFAIINFIWFESFNFFSSRLHATESAILLSYCLHYYLYLLQEDQTSLRKPPSFWVTTGLSIYVVVNFFIFLFYKKLIGESREFAVDIWDVHNISYIIFCIFLAKAFYEAKQSVTELV